MNIHPRAEWVLPSQPVTGPRQIWAWQDALVIHYPGGPKRVPVDMVRELRAGHAWYLADRNQSYGYNWAINTDGQIWEIRGTDIQCGAQGSSTWNPRSVAVQLIADGESQATAAQIISVRWLRAWLETAVYRRPLRLYGHRQVRSQTFPSVNIGPAWTTRCPGEPIWGQLQSGVFNPLPLPPPSPIEEIDMRYTLLTVVYPADGVGIVYICSENAGTKAWVQHGDADDRLRARINAANTARPGSASLTEITTADPAVIQSFGPLDPVSRDALIDEGYLVDAWGMPR